MRARALTPGVPFASGEGAGEGGGGGAREGGKAAGASPPLPHTIFPQESPLFFFERTAVPPAVLLPQHAHLSLVCVVGELNLGSVAGRRGVGFRV